MRVTTLFKRDELQISDVNDGTNVIFLRTTSFSKSRGIFFKTQAKISPNLQKYGNVISLTLTYTNGGSTKWMRTQWGFQYQTKPTKKHFKAIKRVFRYLKGTINMGLWYPKDNAMSLTKLIADADQAVCTKIQKK
ncbi:hypothetical protein Tco_0740440 [Tanacetum coccineum]